MNLELNWKRVRYIMDMMQDAREIQECMARVIGENRLDLEEKVCLAFADSPFYRANEAKLQVEHTITVSPELKDVDKKCESGLVELETRLRAWDFDANRYGVNNPAPKGDLFFWYNVRKEIEGAGQGKDPNTWTPVRRIRFDCFVCLKEPLQIPIRDCFKVKEETA